VGPESVYPKAKASAAIWQLPVSKQSPGVCSRTSHRTGLVVQSNLRGRPWDSRSRRAFAGRSSFTSIPTLYCSDAAAAATSFVASSMSKRWTGILIRGKSVRTKFLPSRKVARPIFLSLTLHRWRLRVLYLHPMRWIGRAIRRARRIGTEGSEADIHPRRLGARYRQNRHDLHRISRKDREVRMPLE
jgi:hypothetical protein